MNIGPMKKYVSSLCAAVSIFLFLIPAAEASTPGTGVENETGSLSASFYLGRSCGGASPLVALSPQAPTAVADGAKTAAAGRVPKARFGRAAIELGSFLLGSGVNYWIEYSSFIEDWQYRFTLKDQAKRFFGLSAVRLDSNDFKLNWSHSLSGAFYYQFARTNDLSWLGSWGFSAFGALFWEYCVEWREIISINDLVFTGLGGYPSGEAWFQLGNFLANSESPVMRAFSFIDPALKINRWLDRKKAPRDRVLYGQHEFSLEVGARSLKKTGGYEFDEFFGLKTEIINPPEYNSPGSAVERIKDTYSSTITANFAWDDSHAQETNLYFGVRNIGRFTRNLDELGRGYTLYIGLGSALSYFKKRPVEPYDFSLVAYGDLADLHLELPRNFRDKIAVVHVIGPAVDYTLRRQGFQLRAQAEAFVDFALVNSYALNKYSESNDVSGMKTTILYFGYYYGLGGTASARVEMRAGNLRASGEALYQRWDSIEGHDRFQSSLTDDCDMDDSRTMLAADASWRIPRSFIEIFGRYEHIRRWGRIKDFGVTGSEDRSFIGMRLLF